MIYICNVGGRVVRAKVKGREHVIKERTVCSAKGLRFYPEDSAIS